MIEYKIAVSSDLHAQIGLGKTQVENAGRQGASLIIDTGDRAVMRFPKKHWLREGQQLGEPLEDVVVRNANKSGYRHTFFKGISPQVFGSMIHMQKQVNAMQASTVQYRGIAGNTEETWTEIFTRMNSPERAKRVGGVLKIYGLIEEADVEFFVDGGLYNDDRFAGPANAVFLYLPWKASIRSVKQALEKMKGHIFGKVFVFSHDYLTSECLPEAIRGQVKPCQNEEQSIMVLEELSKCDGDVTIFYGHIGWKYNFIEHGFKYNRKDMIAKHHAGKDGSLYIQPI